MSASTDVSNDLATRLGAVVVARAAPAAAEWFQEQVTHAAKSSARQELLLAFASAGRRLGSAPLDAAALENASLRPELARQLIGRGLDETGRVALLLTALGAAGSDPASTDSSDEELVRELFIKGSAGETQAVVRALPLLGSPERFLPLAIDAVRSSVQTIFEAIACENPYPERHFSEAAFNQLVLKALFNQVSTARIFGLAHRAGPELARMCQGYAAERRAAGRSVPDDIEMICALSGAKR